MIAPQCPVHKIPMTLKPSGVSRTGKRYPSFWGCPDMTDGEFCDTSTILATDWEKTQAESPVEAFKSSLKEEPIKKVEVEDPMTKAEWREKDDRIARLTLAKTFIQAGVTYQAARENGDLNEWTEWVLNG